MYEIFCGRRDRSYGVHTSRSRRISVRLEEQKHTVIRSLNTSSLANHIKETGHYIDFDRTITIAKIEHLTSRIPREVIEIKYFRQNRLPAIWKFVSQNSKRKPTNNQQKNSQSINININEQHTTNCKSEKQSDTQPLRKTIHGSILNAEIFKTFSIDFNRKF